MRILFLTHYFPPEGNAPASRTYENCKRWVKAGHDVDVITCVPNVPDGVVYEGYKNCLKQTELVDGIKVTRVWTYIAANKGTSKRIMNYLSYMFSAVFWGIFSKKLDVIIATSPQFFCGWAGVILSKLRRKKFILEIRDIWPESIVAVGAMQNSRMLNILEWLELKMYATADHIVTVGEGYKQRLIEKNVDKEKISVVMNGVDTELFSPMDRDIQLQKKWGLDGKFVCSYVGTVGMACGLEVVIEAARKLKQMGRENIAFLIVGDGARRDELQKMATEHQLDNIVFTGRQDKDLIPNFLSISDACLVHLKNTELFKTVIPSKIFEAAGMAKPIIIGVAGFATEIVKRANAGICIEPENAEQLAQEVKNLADDPQLCQLLGQAGREYVMKHHNRDSLANEYLDIIVRFVSPVIEG